MFILKLTVIYPYRLVWNKLTADLNIQSVTLCYDSIQIRFELIKLKSFLTVLTRFSMANTAPQTLHKQSRLDLSYAM